MEPICDRGITTRVLSGVINRPATVRLSSACFNNFGPVQHKICDEIVKEGSVAYQLSTLKLLTRVIYVFENKVASQVIWCVV